MTRFDRTKFARALPNFHFAFPSQFPIQKIMAHTYSEILLHIIFSTKNRRPTIRPEFRERLHSYMGGILRSSEAIPIAINGPQDHVHILLTLPRNSLSPT
jgi:REP element-mobilizing transposase RayT